MFALGRGGGPPLSSPASFPKDLVPPVATSSSLSGFDHEETGLKPKLTLASPPAQAISWIAGSNLRNPLIPDLGCYPFGSKEFGGG
jgi:hypothetical protein